jgi:hypothetical protein
MRQFSKLTTTDTRHLLSVLIDPASDPAAYQGAMTALGRQLGETVAKELPVLAGAQTVCVACTVEDADYLARGVLDGLMASGLTPESLKFVCFWNERVHGFDGSEVRSFDVAPVLKQYREKADLDNSVVVIVKSIISGACVVKTNLATLIEDVTPSRVFVAAPVMLKGAEERLASEFPDAIAKRFEYMTFAIDDEKRDDDVIPGIGGSVYARLGFEDKNAYVPEIVKQRRKLLAAA